MGKRSQSGQKKRNKDTLKGSLTDFGILPQSWEQVAQQRAKRCILIRKGANNFETKRICEAEHKRKARANIPVTDLPASDLSCSICNRQIRAQV
ncbi:MAG: hypothetical protein AB2693_20560, partial [Candidatus Thiodiazotropha sp.]